MKVLVTGATGFIGNYVIEQLLEQGHIVIATSTSIETAKQKKWFDKVTFIPYKIYEEKENLYTFFNEPDVLIHLAWGNLNNFKSQLHIDEELPKHSIFLKNIMAGQ